MQLQQMSNIDRMVMEKFLETSDLINQIDLLIRQNFTYTRLKTDKVKRGQTQNLIAESLSLVLNNKNQNLIITRIEAFGGVPSVLHGKGYYRCIAKKEDTV